ncbi:acetoin utilization protein AcuC [Rhizosaccharibacter radicis]|uniref:Acetoin utilization protein AcuC n=1 Tax=Rhizosaccharibacter radicis TaxID=2782605 RepID=A0ABT1VZI0_9PROT|nr:acetoin utilization protein AcuC [Acetobacteraceae bacterium KSS12]
MRAPPLLVGSEIYRGSSYGKGHPMAVARVSVCLDLCRALGWVDPGRYLDAPMARPEEVTRFHDPAYVSALREAERRQAVSEEAKRRFNIGVNNNPVFPEMYRRPMTSAGAVMLAARRSAEARNTVFTPGGGTHHGRPGGASGFCYLNDVVLGLLEWRRLGLRRLAYVDIDAHHGDGVQDAFADDPDVLTISIHEINRWPRTGAVGDRAGGAARNMPVPSGFHDGEMRLLMRDAVLPLLRRHRPEALMLQAGADSLEDDPLSHLSLSNNAYFEAAASLAALAEEAMLPFVVTGGGGYNPFSVGRCWAGIWGVLDGHALPDLLPPGAEAVMRALEFPHRLGRSPPERWFTTLRDPPREGPVRPEVRRLAGLVLEEAA